MGYNPNYKWINPTYPIYNWGYNPLTKWDEPPSSLFPGLWPCKKKNFPAQLGRIWSALRSHELGPCVRESGARSYSCFYPLHSFTAAWVYLICSNLNIGIWQCVKTFSFSRRLESQTLVKQGLAARRGLGSSPHTKVSVLRHGSMYCFHSSRTSTGELTGNPFYCSWRSWQQYAPLP